MKDSKQLYEDLSADFKEEKYYSFADRGEGMLQARENNGKRFFLVNKEKKEAWELVNAMGTFSLWNVSVVEISSIFDIPGLAQRNAMSTKVPYFFGIEDYSKGVTLVVWTLQPDGCYYADSNGYGMTDDEEINIYAYIDKEGHIIVPFQPMDCDLKKRYRPQAEKIGANRETLPYVSLSTELTIPFEENYKLQDHKELLTKILYGMILQMSAMAVATDGDREYDGTFSVLSAINPDPAKHLDYALYAKKIDEQSDKFELTGLTMLYVGDNDPVGCRSPYGEFSSLEISRIMENKENVELLLNDFIEAAAIVVNDNLPKPE